MGRLTVYQQRRINALHDEARALEATAAHLAEVAKAKRDQAAWIYDPEGRAALKEQSDG